MLRNDLPHSAKILGESLRVDFEQVLRRLIEPAAVTGVGFALSRPMLTMKPHS
jgi:hypothetical protein